ncbi:uncharacterized protein [Procambarus clarkii]|nr:uncharacterized protein LOC123757589 [Procambarus clarkii]XP_045597323.1 uncharacterized protein LOC123757589 [Procambarus clarkii]
MARACVVVMVVMAIGAVMAAKPPCLSLNPKVDIPRCTNSCQAEDKPGLFFCCDNKGTNAGKCPRVHLQQDEREVLCDKNQLNYPNHLNCKQDSDCHLWEKCCFLPDNNQLICRSSEV